MWKLQICSGKCLFSSCSKNILTTNLINPKCLYIVYPSREKSVLRHATELRTTLLVSVMEKKDSERE